MEKRELIKLWGQNTAYSAKSHFKSGDFKRLWLMSLVVVNILFAIFSILELGLPTLTKIFGITSLIASVLILVYESQEDKSVVNRHMKIGDEYLTIHYELQELFAQTNISEEEFERVSRRIKTLNKKDKPIINQIGKWMAKRAIEKKHEMTKWW